MACDSTTLSNLIKADGLTKLSQRDLLICLAAVFGARAGLANAQAALNLAYTDKLQGLSDRDLLAALEAALC
jgi:hypothetical protein